MADEANALYYRSAKTGRRLVFRAAEVKDVYPSERHNGFILVATTDKAYHVTTRAPERVEAAASKQFGSHYFFYSAPGRGQ